MGRGRKVDQIIIDEASYISEEDWENMKIFSRESAWEKIFWGIKKIAGIKSKDYWMGIDFAKDADVWIGHTNKSGAFVVDKMKKLNDK